jgi:hypothetical protein
MGSPNMPEQQRAPDEKFAEYDPVEGQRGVLGLLFGSTNTEVAASGAKINTHVPTPDEIAKRKYIIRRHWAGPRWFRWLFGTGEYAPK